MRLVVEPPPDVLKVVSAHLDKFITDTDMIGSYSFLLSCVIRPLLLSIITSLIPFYYI